MFNKLFWTATALVGPFSATNATGQDAVQLPKPIAAIAGCWTGRGEVMGKPVTITIAAKPIVQNALLALDAESAAIADSKDRYSAHLIFGGADKPSGATAEPITGFWADSFGGAFTATGRGEGRADGFDISYQYADNAFVNRWRISGDQLAWQIVARDGAGAEKPFASYSLHKAACGNR